jgi:pseudaminic acid synthase
LRIKIGQYELGDACPVFVVAELSGNHGGSLDRALEIVRAAKRAGANAIKLQTYTADTITLQNDGKDFLLSDQSPWASYRTLWELYDAAKTPLEWHHTIFEEAKRLKMAAFSSPFDISAVDFLENLNVPAYKIASPEIVDIPLLEKVAKTGKPIVISKGVADLEDLELAVKTLKDNGTTDLIVLQCNSAYPSPMKDSNLKTIQDIPNRFKCLSGLSDHTEGDLAATLSVAFGASMVEKHFALDGVDTVDSFFSLSEQSFTSMVKNIRDAEVSLGQVNYGITETAKQSLAGRRSLYVVEPVKAHECFTSTNVRSIRPGFGLHPKHFKEVIGRCAKRDIGPGERLSWDLIE